MFKEQIQEDFKILREQLPGYELLKKDDYAFNFWVLTKLYNIDEEIVSDYVTEYKDDSIDCFVFDEESKDLFIIQNKYYSEDTKLSKRYINDDFLVRPLDILSKDSYNRSLKLQEIFNKYKDDSDFSIHLVLYVANNNKDREILESFEKYKNTNSNIKCYVDAKIFYLEDIQNVFFECRRNFTKKFKFTFSTINKGTVLNINKDAYKLPNFIDSKYMLTPICQLYNIVKESKEKNYSLFEENVREYLGNKGINAQMATTLENESERDNFFYYNNGITIICESIDEVQIQDQKLNKGYSVHNPQIVNGCQTVTTIFEVLRKYNEDDIKNKFNNTFVMVKLLILSASDKNKELYRSIVKYNNSQNKIENEAFIARKEIFLNMQKDFEQRGFLLAVKQSDENKFKTDRKLTNFKPLLQKYENLFGIQFSNISEIIIPLEKLLQIILAFSKDGYKAFTSKNKVLKQDSLIHIELVDFIKNKGLTTEDILKLYLLYAKAEKDKKISADKRTPISFYIIGFMGNQLKNIEYKKLKEVFKLIYQNKEYLEALYIYYKKATILYRNTLKNKGIEYNTMIKSQIEEKILIESLDSSKEMLENRDREIVQEFEEFLKKI